MRDGRLLAIVDRERLRRILPRMLDSAQFLSDYGLRSLSKEHATAPYILNVDGQIRAVQYEPAEARSGLFGGNSNWRGPIWFPLNVIMIEALRRYHRYFGDTFMVELPHNSGNRVTLDEVADELARRLQSIFLRDDARGGQRAVFGDNPYFQSDPQWRDYLLFYEYFHGDNGAGLGARRQTGWTALVATLLQRRRWNVEGTR